MANREGVILQLYSRARAPNRDYYGLTISQEDVILDVWNITHGPHVFPKKQQCPLADLPIAKIIFNDISRIFGAHIANYCLALGRGDARLECLPSKIFLKILRFLAGNDILRLGQTSKIFFELCNRNDVWGIVFTKRNKCKPSRDEVKAALQKGWKTLLRNKLVWADSLSRNKSQKSLAPRPKIDEKKASAVVSSHVGKKLEAKTPKVNTEVPTKVPEDKTIKVLLEPHKEKTKAIITAKNVNELSNAANQVQPFVKTTSFSTLKPKGILKKSGVPLVSKTTTKLLNFAEKIERIPENPSLVTKIDYAPIAKEERTKRASLSSLLSGFLAKDNPVLDKNVQDRHLGSFLQELDHKDIKNSCRSSSDVINKNLPSSSTRLSYPIAKALARSKPATANAMATKLENYLSSLKGRSVHPSVEVSPRVTTQTNITKSDIMPKISELTRSINQMRSSFYNADSKLKGNLGANLNNSKVANKNGCSQQLNNKLNTVASRSTSTLEMKKNVLRTPTRSAINSVTKSSKVKNTNCTMSISQQEKPKSAPKSTSRNISNMNVKK